MTLNKRVLFFVPTFNGGGAENVAIEIANGFSKNGADVYIAVINDEGPYKSKINKNIKIISLEKNRVIFSVFSLSRLIGRIKPDAVISVMAHANIVSCLAKWMSSHHFSLILTEHSDRVAALKESKELKLKMLPSMVKFFYRKASSVVAVSEGVADGLVNKLGLDSEKVHVIYNPVDIKSVILKSKESVDCPWLYSEEFKVIISVGRLVEAKDFTVLVKAFSVLNDCDDRVKLIILGEGVERCKLEELVKTLGKEDSVLLPGFVANPYAWIKKSKVFVLSSKREGLPGALIEALVCRVPMLSTDCPSGPREILLNGRLGRLTPIGDYEKMAFGLHEILQGKPGLVEISDLEYETALARFDADVVTEKYSELIG